MEALASFTFRLGSGTAGSEMGWCGEGFLAMRTDQDAPIGSHQPTMSSDPFGVVGPSTWRHGLACWRGAFLSYQLGQ